MSDPVYEFVALARQYIALVDGAEDISAHELLTYSARLLPRVYAAGLELPDVSLPDDVEASDEVVSPMSKLLRLFGRFDVYFEVFDPVFEQEAVASSLSDDLADIYLDLARPLAAFDAGQQELRSGNGGSTFGGTVVITLLTHFAQSTGWSTIIWRQNIDLTSIRPDNMALQLRSGVGSDTQDTKPSRPWILPRKLVCQP